MINMKYNYTLVIEGFMGVAPMISLKVIGNNYKEVSNLSVDIFRKPEDELFIHTAQRMVEEIEANDDMLGAMEAYQESLVP